MSISKQFQFSIPSEVEEKLGRCLQEYFIAIENGNDISPIVEQCPFNYKILHSPSYLPNKLAYLGGRYWETDNLLALTLGDTILCVKELVDWLNQNHFDYRELIPKGLALNASGLNIY